ncbi:type ISP restriction/modification enzyme [Flavobacterium nackdongense]|uniref:type ISP restriction/modification enzyme n=1 Tax=Flavobacterium nackdongense TaxID=2547394 RepID=UPI0013FD016D|nr:type ISP restriction/modification enzyme [Flavobacterium nackdongense]
MTIPQYLTKINTLYITGNAREHSYRGDLQNLIMAILPDILVTNEPARVDCGAPDYVLTRKDVPIGYIEAKDIGVDLKDKKLKEQFDRYKSGLTNLIFTDYLDFHFYKDGEFITKIAIARIEKTTPPDGHPSKGGELTTIVPIPENFEQFTHLIQNFALTVSQTIKSPTKLAQMMAGKAKLMADVIEKSLNYDDQQGIRSSIKSQMLSFQQMLIHDIDNKSFADIYSQTIAYGMFAARYHDPTLPTFSRMEASQLIPKSNPFLRKLFQDIAGFDLDTRLDWIVEELVTIFLASDVAQIMKNFGKSTKQEDPVVHFYETFLGEYNPALRKARGVWYTPQPVVNFIVRAVDDILKTEFDLPQGLADTSKIKIKTKVQKFDNRSKNKSIVIGEQEHEQEVHKVQILDPATGTGTFLAEVVRHIYKKFEGQQGIWSKYVTNDLIPRLNGFELLMASYAMAHLKIDMLLTETGYKPQQFPSSGGVSEGRGGDQRFRIFLTNSLEEAHPDTATLFSSWLSDEADQANAIKRDAPVMVVMGNPPYSGESSNKGEWIMNLMEDYKKEPGGKEKLKEKNSKWINDDYVKFIRFGQHFIDKNGSGILAFINPHGFLDNPTFRGMRWNLLKSFDKIYTIDLHGNSTKKEVSPDGSIDQNVFDIMQGVSINLFVKTGKKGNEELGNTFHFDLYGKREYKYDFLKDNDIYKIPYKHLTNKSPMYFMVKKDFDVEKIYNKGFKINELFNLNNIGIVTARDAFTIHNTKEDVRKTIEDFLNLDDETARTKYNLGKDVRDWQVNLARKDLLTHYPNKGFFIKFSYRPFDEKWTFFTGKSKGFHCYPRNDVMQHFLKGDNIGLNLCKLGRSIDSHVYFLSNKITDKNLASSLDSVNTFPLYLYPETTSQQNLLETNTRTPNLNPEIVKQIAAGLGLTFTNEKTTPILNSPPSEGCPQDGVVHKEFAPIDLLDYIYAVLHSPTYRSTYKEFLKIDFPRVPYPTDRDVFYKLVALGGELRQIHLLESPIVEKYITQYPEDGDNVVRKPRFENSPPPEGCPTGGVVNNTPIYFNTIIDLPYNPALKQRAKELRYAENLSEVLFWMQVHKGKFHNIDFDRQRIIGNYIVDFYVKKLGLVIEIDGPSHDTKEEYDKVREDYLKSLGLKIFRIPVIDVLQNMMKAITDLEDFIKDNYSKPPRLAGTPPKEGNFGKVYINETQYFDNVPEVAWNFYIGGYQPAQKWLKDRKERELSYEDILHYQKIIVALSETDRIMKEIDTIEM